MLFTSFRKQKSSSPPRSISTYEEFTAELARARARRSTVTHRLYSLGCWLYRGLYDFVYRLVRYIWRGKLFNLRYSVQVIQLLGTFGQFLYVKRACDARTELAAMRFIAANTSIRIPRPWGRFRSYIIMERIEGDTSQEL